MPLAADLYYYTHEGGNGEQPPLVLIHGAGGSHLSWPPEVRHLPGYNTFALDLPGHGKSAGTGKQSIEAYGEAVFGWLEALKLYRVALIGHSMGGAIALSLALDHPERVLALGLLGSGGRLRVHPDLLRSTMNETTFPCAVTAIIGWAFGTQATPRLVELTAMRMAKTRSSVLHGDFLACDAFDEIARLSEIHQPAFVLCGAEDCLTPPRYSQFLAKTMPNAKLAIIPNAGHMVMLEQPKQVAEELKRFFDEELLVDSLPFPP